MSNRVDILNFMKRSFLELLADKGGKKRGSEVAASLKKRSKGFFVEEQTSDYHQASKPEKMVVFEAPDLHFRSPDSACYGAHRRNKKQTI